MYTILSEPKQLILQIHCEANYMKPLHIFSCYISLQVRSFSSKGLSTGCVLRGTNVSIMEGVSNGEFRLIFFTSEAILNHKRWHNLLRSDVYKERLQVVVIDEAHTVIKW